MKNNYIFRTFSTSKLFLLSLFVMIGFSSVVVGQTTLAKWTFPSTSANATCDESSANNVGKTLTITANGAGATRYTDTGASGTLDKCASATRWDTGADNYYFLFENINTTSFNSVAFSAKVRAGNNNAPRDFKIQYRVNNGSWNDIGSAFAFPASANWYPIASKLILPASAANQADVDIRILQTSNTSIGNGSIGTGGGAWVGVDDVVVEGSSLLATSTLYSENFDGTQNWTINTSALFGIGSQNTLTEKSGNNSLYTIKDENYTDNIQESSGSASSPIINLSGTNSTILEFWSYSDFESSYDYGIVYVVANGSWTKVETLSNTESGWTLHSIDISGIADNKTQVQIYFMMTSDFGDVRTGWNIDDVTIKGIPPAGINVSPNSLNGFTYAAGFGPSSEQSFTVSGYGLTNNITIAPPAGFEISKGTGSSFLPTSNLTLNVSGGQVSPTTIYVRMKAGLPQGTVTAQDIICSSLGQTSKNITCNGTVLAAPIINVNPGSFTGFTYELGNGPSTIVSNFVVNGSNLGGSITITPPPEYEISLNNVSGFTLSPITIAVSSGNITNYTGTIGNTTIYIRLKGGLAVANYNEQINISSPSTTPTVITLEGNVSNVPTISASVTYLGGFIYNGMGPSTVQSVDISGALLKADVTVTPPANFEISTNPASGFGTIALTLPRTGSSLNPTPIYVRLKSGLVDGAYNGEITCTSTGAINKNITCNGTRVSTPSIFVSPSSLNGFSYLLSAGPSIIQNFTVSGTLLGTNNITITPSDANFEIKTASSNWGDPITLTPSSGKVDATIIYVRLKAGLVANTYTNTLTVSATTATNKTVTNNGLVYTQPTITAGISGSTCANSPINLTSTGSTNIANQYWTGPLGFYSLSQNPIINSATSANNGTYIVTGSAPVGINLITNGDFEYGNTGFFSTYTYYQLSAGGLIDEGTYDVIDNPQTHHSGFSTCADHSNTGTKQMVINGYWTDGVSIWRQSVNVLPNAYYQFTYWVQSVTPTSPSVLQLYINGVAAGPKYTADATTCSWKKFIYNWYSGTSTTAELSLINQNTVRNGNDFALDDIVFQQTIPVTDDVDVVVNPILSAGVSIAASLNPLYSGIPVTFTATPVNGGTTPTYQWYKNGSVISGANSSTYSINDNSLAQNDKITCIMTSNYPCITGNPATSNELVSTFQPNYWIGTFSTDWTDTRNWTATKIPLAGDDVIFANGTTYYTSPAVNDLYVDVDGDRTVGGLINYSNQALVVPPGKSIIVNSTIKTNGNSDRIKIKANSTQANGSLVFNNPASTPVQASVEMFCKASITASGAEDQKYFWQYFGVPVETLDADPTFYGAYVRRSNEAGNESDANYYWTELGTYDKLTKFLGYEICQPTNTTYTFKGQLVNTDFNSGLLPISNNGDLSDPVKYPGQHLFANPYTTAINVDKIEFGSDMEQSVFLYNTGSYGQWVSIGGENTSGTAAGQYLSIPQNIAGYAGIPGEVPSMSSMLVKTGGNGTPGSYIKMKYSEVAKKNTTQQRVKSIDGLTNTDLISTRIDLTGQHYSDRMWIFTEPSCTRNFDNGWDGRKILGSSLAPQIYAMEPDGDYQVNSISDMHNTDLAFQAGDEVEYTLKFTHENIQRQYAGVYLVDLVENKTVDVSQNGSTYTFATAQSDAPAKRFKILTRPYEKGAPDKEAQVKIFTAPGRVFVHNLSTFKGECTLYDIAGRAIKIAPFEANAVTEVLNNLTPGAYVVNTITNGEKVSKRVIVQ